MFLLLHVSGWIESSSRAMMGGVVAAHLQAGDSPGTVTREQPSSFSLTSISPGPCPGSSSGSLCLPHALHPQLCSQHWLFLAGGASQLCPPMPGYGKKLAESHKVLWTAAISH